MEADPTIFTPALQYGALGLATIVIVLAAYGLFYMLKKFTDQVIRQANKFSDVSVETILVLKQIKDSFHDHSKSQEEVNQDIVRSLTRIETKMNSVVK